MRASTLFGLTVAGLLGLGVVVGAKYLGYLDNEPIAADRQETPMKVLVARKPLFRGVALSAADVEVRPLTNPERGYYEKNKDRLVPALVHAVDYRVLVKNIGANQILTEDLLEPAAIPETISERLDPGMRSVHLTLPRDRAAGGLLRIGERVDVLLTTAITPDGKGARPFTATAPIARNLKIIVKRDNLWTVMRSDPENKPATFTLQANPYRAALIEFAKLKGLITMVPSAPTIMGKADKEPMNDPDSREYRDEDRRVADYLNNEHMISDGDLERIFNLRLMAQPEPPPPLRVELLSGVKVKETAVFPTGVRYKEDVIRKRVDAGAVPGSPPTQVASTSFSFHAPDARSVRAAGSSKDCPTCK